MTPAAFLLAFAEALSRPEVENASTPHRLRFLVPAWRPAGDKAVCDPVTLVWWARTGEAHTSRLISGLRYAQALGLSREDAEAVLGASDSVFGHRLALDRHVLQAEMVGLIRQRFRPSDEGGGASPATH